MQFLGSGMWIALWMLAARSRFKSHNRCAPTGISQLLVFFAIYIHWLQSELSRTIVDLVSFRKRNAGLG